MDKKHYIMTALTLGLIGAASAALIGLTNLATRDQIAENERQKIALGIRRVFSSSTVSYEEINMKESGLTGSYKFVQTVYSVKEENASVGYAFKASGSNTYGKITLIAGFSETTHEFSGVYLVVNEQTYASTLNDKYIDPVNDGSRDVSDTSCGATYGAKLVEEMIVEAKSAANVLWGSNNG